MKKNNKQANKNGKALKAIITILSVILTIVVICDIVYFSYIAIGRSKAEKQLSQTVDQAVEQCLDTLDQFKMTEKQQEYIATYQQNMENAETVLQKAYIANAMLTYAAASCNLENSNRITEIYNSGGAGQAQNDIVNQLSAQSSALKTAIHNYTLYNED